MRLRDRGGAGYRGEAAGQQVALEALGRVGADEGDGMRVIVGVAADMLEGVDV